MNQVLEEVFKDYSVSKNGHVTKLSTGEQLRPFVNGQGYISVQLTINHKPKRVSVHRMVAYKYVKNPLGKPFVNHIDGEKQNNYYKNLEWVTPQENSTHAKHAGLLNRKKVNELFGAGITYESLIKKDKKRLVDHKQYLLDELTKEISGYGKKDNVKKFKFSKRMGFVFIEQGCVDHNWIRIRESEVEEFINKLKEQIC
jgi:hypothetical protein